MFSGMIQSSYCSQWLPNNLEIGNLELTPGKKPVDLEEWSLRSTAVGRSRRVKYFPAVDEEQLGSSGEYPLNLLHRSAEPLIRCVEILAANKATENG